MQTTPTPPPQRPTWVEISLANLAHNCRVLKQQLPADTQLMAIVKADAYGHGAPRCAQVLEQTGVDWFGVALLEEALELRAAGISKSIFCLGGFWPAQAEALIAHNLTPALFRLDACCLRNGAEDIVAVGPAESRWVALRLQVPDGTAEPGSPTF